MAGKTMIRAALAAFLTFAVATVPRAEEAAPQAAANEAPTLPADPGFATLRYNIANDPDAALDRIAALLAVLQKDDAVDARVIFDLYALAADLMIEGGSAAQAAQVKAQLADFAAALRVEVGRDPIPLYAQAAALLEDTDQLEAARESLLSLLAEQQASGLSAGETAPALAALARVATGLGGRSPDLPAPPQVPALQKATLFFATDRARNDEGLPQSFYGGGRGDPEFGRAEVSLPDPVGLGHAVLRRVDPLAEAGFYARLDRALASRAAPELLVYVHGAGMGFEEAARRAAGLAVALRFDGLPVLYSWASGGSVVDYIGDTAAADLSGPRLARFLEALRQRAGARRIHLLAEGLGARPLLAALMLMQAGHPGQGPLFGQIILAAPDVDAGLFQEIAPQIRPLALRLTLYASDQARTLSVARELYGDALRAGDGGTVTLTQGGVDSIDISGWGRDPLRPQIGAPALTDIATLIRRDAPPSRRCGLAETLGGAGDGVVWVVSDATNASCSDPAWPDLLAALTRAAIRDWPQAQRILQEQIADPARRSQLEPVLRRLIGG